MCTLLHYFCNVHTLTLFCIFAMCTSCTNFQCAHSLHFFNVDTLALFCIFAFLQPPLLAFLESFEKSDEKNQQHFVQLTHSLLSWTRSQARYMWKLSPISETITHSLILCNTLFSWKRSSKMNEDPSLEYQKKKYFLCWCSKTALMHMAAPFYILCISPPYPYNIPWNEIVLKTSPNIIVQCKFK